MIYLPPVFAFEWDSPMSPRRGHVGAQRVLCKIEAANWDIV
ncbi:hypothetical protein HMPREF3198_01138 [Winkia neuii]|nr:hypothetical protein HMPREF3198_01138 [Winkia neuii]